MENTNSKKQNHLEGLPTFKLDHKVSLQNSNMVSLLYMITSPEVSIQDNHLEVPLDAYVVLFSDRPHRIAKSLQGGLAGLAEFWSNSDFNEDPPNVTFAGNLTTENKEYYTVFELTTPIRTANAVLFPIVEAIGKEELVPDGVYSNVSLVVDNIWSTIGKAAEAAGAAIGTAALGVTAVGTCTVGEVLSAGTDTALCIAAAAGTDAAALATAGIITDAVASA